MSQTQNVQDMQATIDSLEAQLVELYNEKQLTPNPSVLTAALANLEAQLVDLYAERAEISVPLHQVKQTIASLEEQVISLVDEKLELESKVTHLHLQMERFKRKSKVLGAAIMEAALFESEVDAPMKKAA